MQRGYFSILIAVCCAVFSPVLISNVSAQIKNNLLPTSDGSAKSASATIPSGTKQASMPSAKSSDPKDVSSVNFDQTKVKELSDQELDDVFGSMVSHFSKDAVLYNNVGASYFERKMYDKAETAVRHAL